MRVSMVSLLLAGIVAMAGCSGSDDGGAVTTTTAPTTSPTPTPTAANVPPTVVLTVKDLGGNITVTTFVGGSFIFDPAGTMDPDGSLGAVAITVDDGNRSITKPLLVDGALVTAAFTFDRAGPVDVTVNAADNRNAIQTLSMQVFVNFQLSITPPNNPIVQNPDASATDCDGTIDPVLDSQYSTEINFPSTAKTTFVTAQVSNRDVEIAICDIGRNPISDAGTDVRTAAGTVFMEPAGGESYRIFLVVTGLPGTPTVIPGGLPEFPQPVIQYVVHYEPDTGA